MLDPISDPKLKEIQKKLKEREKNYQRYAKPSRLILTSGIWVPPAIVVSYLWMLKISGFKGDVFHVAAPILIWFCIVTTSTFFLNKRASVFSLNQDQKMILYMLCALENFANYFQQDKTEINDQDRKTSIKIAQKALSALRKCQSHVKQ